ncbi:hypothetical protein [Microbacterium sp. PF5]|uniref:hypothetical protein n=1 Tax=Microbacterium sp. PF5 TaxID=2305435 RepID=UPI00109B7F26|nr:hypothetical protein [Microbacterium sp. PF5]
MELELSNTTVVLFGPGNEVDRVILRSLASEGCSTYATRFANSGGDLAQHSSSTRQWVAIEDEIGERAVRRVASFLADQGLCPDAVIFHVDVIDALTARAPHRWWRSARETKEIRQRVRNAVKEMVRASAQAALHVILLHRLASDGERTVAHRWLQRTMASLIRSSPDTVRVNAVLLSSELASPAAGGIVAFLSSPLGATISGAIVPIDGGGLARDQAFALEYEEALDD